MRYREGAVEWLQSVSAISFDFYDTLAVHAPERGRGRRLMAYFAAQGWQSQEWVHEVLRDVFRPHGRDYDPAASADTHREFCERIALTLFERMAVQAPPDAARMHAIDLWNILGPDSLTLFPDVEPTLRKLKSAGYRIVITSNWECGLGGFCQALGLGDLVEHVIVSAEVESEKPDRRIFDEARRRLDADATDIVHVGDTLVADYEGARSAGFHAVLLDRYQRATEATATIVSDLTQFARLLGVE